jgi:hypothetical protein
MRRAASTNLAEAVMGLPGACILSDRLTIPAPPPNRRSIALKLENTGDYFQKYKCRSTRLFES